MVHQIAEQIADVCLISHTDATPRSHGFHGVIGPITILTIFTIQNFGWFESALGLVIEQEFILLEYYPLLMLEVVECLLGIHIIPQSWR